MTAKTFLPIMTYLSSALSTLLHKSKSNLLGYLVLTSSLILLALMAVLSFKQISGYRIQVIVSGSMRPNLQPGYLVVTRAEALTEYKKGDVVTFRDPFLPDNLITHRIVQIETSKGLHVVETKGDANPVADTQKVPMGSIVGKQIFSIPLIGFLIFALKTQLGFLVFSLLFFLFFIYREIVWWCEIASQHIRVLLQYRKKDREV